MFDDMPWGAKVLMSFGIAMIAALMFVLFAMMFVYNFYVGMGTLLIFVISLLLMFYNELKPFLNKFLGIGSRTDNSIDRELGC